MRNRMQKLIGGLCAAAWIASLPLIAHADAVILHTNDVHCGVAKNIHIAAVTQYKHDLQKENPEVILVDAGDAVQGEPLGSLSRGAALIRIMNRADYDFAIPGNHEYDFGMDRFLELASQLKCGYYSCNFIDKRTNQPVFKTHKIVTLDGKRIALIGVTTPETIVSSSPKEFQDENGKFVYSFLEDEDGSKLYEGIQKMVDEARAEGAQYVMLVAHLGTTGAVPVWSSGAVAAHTSGIDVIIDGHSHEQYTRVDKNKDGKDVLVEQTGTKLASVGKITIHDDGTITGELVKGLTAVDADVKRLVDEELAQVERQLAKPVGTTTVDLVTDVDGEYRVRSGETNLGDFVADAFRASVHADVALVNGGGFREPISTGKVTYKTLAALFPFTNNLVVRSVTGQQLLDALEMGAAKYPEESGGFFHVSGLTYTIDARVPSSVVQNEQGGFVRVDGAYRVKDVMVGGVPLDLTEDYTVVSNSYIMRNGGNGMTMFDGTPLLRDTAFSDIDAIADYVKEQGGVVGKGYENPAGAGRITILE